MCASCLGHYNKVCYIPNIDMMHHMKLSRFFTLFPFEKKGKKEKPLKFHQNLNKQKRVSI